MMTSWFARVTLATTLVLGGCGSKKSGSAEDRAVSAEDRAVCEQAADRWVGCARELLGEEMAREAERKRDIDGCAADGRTVAMYRTCLPEPTCEAMMACIDRVVAGD